ncbi:MAG: PQQ-binding-like beta-propeller repeat protein [Gemmatimonadetes bacterium]|nr:PQQ-binding-like beta-propeller repeat protein [Gemmatimonadota bacterium]
MTDTLLASGRTRLIDRAAFLRWSLVPGLVLITACAGDSPGTTEPPVDPIAPDADFTASPLIGLAPLNVTFDGSTSGAFDGTIVSYDWDFGDGATGTGSVVQHGYAEPGLYTVSLTVTNNVGKSDRETIDDMIEANRTLWRFDVDKPIYYSAPAVGLDGTIYVSTGILLRTNFGRVHAVNPDGTEKWTADLDQNVPPPDGTVRAENNGSSPAIGPDGTVYVVDHRNVIYAFEPMTGAREWTNNDYESALSWAVGQKTPAIAADGTLYVCADHSLIALDPVDGSELWNRDIRGGNVCATSAVIDGDGVIYIVSNDWLHAFEPDGSPHWAQPFELALIQEKSYSSPAIGADGVLYFGAEKSGGGFAGYFYAVNPGGTLKWRYEVDGARQVRASPAIGSDGTIYVTTKAYYDPANGAQPALALAFNPDGSVKWRYEIPPSNEDIPADSYTSPAIGADGNIYFAAENGYIFALDSDGAVVWRENFHNTMNWSSPMIMDDGTLYIGGNQGESGGRLVAVQTSSLGLDPGAWPRFRGNATNTGRVR